MPLLFIGIDNWLLELLLFCCRHGFTLAREVIHGHLRHNTSGLFPTHDRNSGVGPHEHQGRIVGTATHSDRKSTRLNSSHVKSSYAVFCLKKKNQTSKQAKTEQ